MGGRVKLAVAALAVSALALTGISFAAGGGTTPKLRTASFTISGGTANGNTAMCPKGQHVLSGGEVQSGGPANLVQTSTFPLDNGKGWAQTMVSHDFNTNSQGVKVMAICSERRANMYLTRYTVDSGDARGQVMSCERSDERAVGGGILPVDFPAARFLVKANGPLNRSGVALNTNDGDKPVKWFTATANLWRDPQLVAQWILCLPKSKAKIQTTQFQVNVGDTAEGVAKCGRNKTAIGGGVMPAGSTRSTNVRASGPLTSSPFVEDVGNGDTAKKWYGAVENFDAGPGKIVKIMIVCE